MPPVTEDPGKGEGIAKADLLYVAIRCTLMSTAGRREPGWSENKERARENVGGNWARSQRYPTPTTMLCRGDFGSGSLFRNQGKTIWLFAVKEDS